MCSEGERYVDPEPVLRSEGERYVDPGPVLHSEGERYVDPEPVLYSEGERYVDPEPALCSKGERYVKSSERRQPYCTAVADLHSKILDAHPPPGLNSYNFMQFLGKFGKIVCCPPRVWHPNLEEILDLPLYRSMLQISSRFNISLLDNGESLSYYAN